MPESDDNDRRKNETRETQGRKKRSLSELYGKDPDEALKRFLQTPKRKDEEDDEDEENGSEGDKEDGDS